MPEYAKNKRARYDYEILETYEAGLVLTGQEVKSIRNGFARLDGAFVTFHGDSANLTNLHISKYRYASPKEEYIPDHTRRLLLKKREIDYVRGKSLEAGLTIIPLSLYTKGRHIKVEIGVAKGKKEFDKRETIKKRDTNREIKRALKSER
jgi:SsrA-binding protein